MAEILGTAAAIVQFVDVAIHLSSSIGRLCSDIRNVSRRFHRLQADLHEQVDVAQHILACHPPTLATTVGPLKSDHLLVEYIVLANDLCKTIDGLLPNKADGLLQRGWDSLCSVRKKGDVSQMCDRLEQKKSTLSMWLSAANL